MSCRICRRAESDPNTPLFLVPFNRILPARLCCKLACFRCELGLKGMVSLFTLLIKKALEASRAFRGEYRIRTDHLFTASEAL